MTSLMGLITLTARTSLRQAKAEYANRLNEALDPRPRDDRRLLLPLGKGARSFEVYIHARERLAVPLSHSHAPMMMLAAAILAELRCLSLCHRQPSFHAQLLESYRRLRVVIHERYPRFIFVLV